MTPRDTTADERWLTRNQRAAFALVAVVCILLAGAAVVTAQQVQGTDDFEDGDVDGWEGENFEISSSSVEGNHSLRADDGLSGQEENPTWESGPELDLTEEFTATGTSKISQGGGNPYRAGFGIVESVGSDDTTGVILLFSQEYDQTFIANSHLEDPSGLDTIGGYYNNQWVNWEIESDGGGNVTARVWEYGTDRSTAEVISRQMDPEQGSFSIFSGQSDLGGRAVFLDSVTVEGTQAPPDGDELRLDVPKYLQHNSSSHYAVEANQSGTWVDVTEDANVTPANTDALTFHPSNNTVVAGGNKSINERINVTATYEGLTATGNIVVATPTVDNLDLLPAWWSVNALLSDWTVIWILMATLIATAATRMATTFAGIGAFVMAMVMGWIMGDVPNGIMVATTFMGIFIGLNLAANIDYSVR